MARVIMVGLLALIASVASDPLVYEYGASPYYASPFLASPYSAALVAAPEAVVAPIAPVATAVPYASVSAYSYGSGYNIKDYALAAPAPAALAPLTYSVPSVYDYFLRR